MAKAADIHHLFGSAEARSPAATAIGIVRRCRLVLARYLARESGLSPSRTVQLVQAVLETPHRAGGPLRARELVRLAEVVIRDVPAADRVGLLIDIFDGPAAREYASPELPVLVDDMDLA